jgi:hypothetical protein
LSDFESWKRVFLTAVCDVDAQHVDDIEHGVRALCENLQATALCCSVGTTQKPIHQIKEEPEKLSSP